MRLEGRFPGPIDEARVRPPTTAGGARTAATVRRSARSLEQALAMAAGFPAGRPVLQRVLGVAPRGHVRRRPRRFAVPGGIGHGDPGWRTGTTWRTRSTTFWHSTVANGFRYFEHPWSGIDSDTLGVYLRLRSFATNRDAALAAAARVMGCLGETYASAGGCRSGSAAARTRLATARPCSTLAKAVGPSPPTCCWAFLRWTPSDDREVLEIGALDLLNRIRDRGLGRERQLSAALRAWDLLPADRPAGRAVGQRDRHEDRRRHARGAARGARASGAGPESSPHSTLPC